MMPLDCLIRTSFYSKLIFKCLWPLAVYVLFGVSAKFERRRGKDGSADTLINLLFLVMFIVYPGVSSSLLSMFYCVELEDGSSYLRPDLSLECSTGMHAAMLVFTFAMIVVHTIGTPAIYAYLFFWKHHVALEALKEQELQDARIAHVEQEKTYINNVERVIVKTSEVMRARIKPEDVLPGYMLKLTGGYEYRTYWFELFETIRKVLIVGVPSTFPDRGGTAQLFWASDQGLQICSRTQLDHSLTCLRLMILCALAHSARAWLLVLSTLLLPTYLLPTYLPSARACSSASSRLDHTCISCCFLCLHPHLASPSPSPPPSPALSPPCPPPTTTMPSPRTQTPTLTLSPSPLSSFITGCALLSLRTPTTISRSLPSCRSSSHSSRRSRSAPHHRPHL